MVKRRTIIVSLLVLMALTLTGCSTANTTITSATTFSEMFNEGFFSGLITYPIAKVLNFLEPNVGIALAIAIVTIAVNAIVLAFTFKSNVQMQRMQELQPEMARIQAKYEGRTDDMSKQRMAAEMQQLYSKYDINPIGSLITTFIQLPILLGMYNAVQRSQAVKEAVFLGSTLSTAPKDAFLKLDFVCIVIYVLMIVFQLLSLKAPQWIANYRGKKEADKHHKTYKKPADQNIFMSYGMVLVIGFAMLTWPTALSLYYLIYSLINIIKTLVIDKLTHKEEA